MRSKAAVEEHRVPERTRNVAAQRSMRVKQVAVSIGLAAWAANHTEGGGGRDASTFTTKDGRQGKGKRRGGKFTQSYRALHLGGHRLWKSGRGWECTVCRRASRQWGHIASEKC